MVDGEYWVVGCGLRVVSAFGWVDTAICWDVRGGFECCIAFLVSRPAGTSSVRATSSDDCLNKTWKNMLEMMGEGETHIKTQHKLACALQEDGCASAQVGRFAACGHFGRYAQNIERDMHRMILKTDACQEVPLHEIKFDALQSDGEIREQTFSVVAPHTYLQKAYAHGNLVFQTAFLGEATQDDLLEFWDNFFQQPFGCAHPCAEAENTLHLEKTVPLIFHCDGAESYRNVEAIIWSMSSAYAAGNVFDSRFPLLVLLASSVPSAELLSGAHAAICKFIGWSLKICLSGMMDGQELAGGWRAAFAFWKGDRKCRKDTKLHFYVSKNTREHAVTKTQGTLFVFCAHERIM